MLRLAVMFLCLIALPIFGWEPLYLKNNLAKASKGDFIVTLRAKNYTLLNIHDADKEKLWIEEISIPSARLPKEGFNWRSWVSQGAPWNTSWLIYEVDMKNGEITKMFSVSRNSWCQLRNQDNFLSTLLTLRLTPIQNESRKRVGAPPLPGSPDFRPFWSPRMRVDGQVIPAVAFDAWQTVWPKDNSELAGKAIQVYTPTESGKYPSYFPYWLEISGIVGSAKIHMVDSGTALVSPAQFPKLSTIPASSH